MLRLAAPILALLIIAAAAAISDRPLPRADFTFVNRGDVSTLDISTMSWMQDLRIGRSIYEGLVMTDPFRWDETKRPGVAESWDISPDRRNYTFHLRADAKWSNGDPVRASDFIYSWRRATIPDSAGDFFKFYAHIRGATDFYRWRADALARFASEHPAAESLESRRRAADALWKETESRFASTVAVRAVDERTITIELLRPVPYFLDLLAFPALYPLHERSLRLYERLDPETARIQWEQGWTKPPHHITNGPFMLTRWRFKRDMRLDANPYYWNRDALAIRSIDIPTMDDDNTEVLAFRSGAIDWASDITAPYRAEIVAGKRAFLEEYRDEVERLRAQGLDPIAIDRALPSDPRNTISILPVFGTYFYNFNCAPTLADGRSNPFADPRVRKAFALAADKRALVEDIRRVGEPVARTLIPPNSIPAYPAPKGLETNPELARTLLAQAGFPDGRGFPVVEVLFNKEGGHDLNAQALAKDWEARLGVQVVLRQREIKVFREDLKNGNFMISRAGWFGDYGDPTTFLDINRTGDGNNDRRYSSPVYDSLLARAEAETDSARRLDLLAQAERLIIEEDFPLLPLYHYSQFYLFDPHRVSGISSHPRQEQHLYLLDILGDGKGSDVPRSMPPRPPAEPAR
jgi:oligopeptide transport system substrate-binding protein